MSLQVQILGSRTGAYMLASNQVVAYAQSVGKPLVREKLDFSRRNQELASASPGRAQQLSSFAYSGIQQALDSSALLQGISMAEMNPEGDSAADAVLRLAELAARKLSFNVRAKLLAEAGVVSPVREDVQGTSDRAYSACRSGSA